MFGSTRRYLRLHVHELKNELSFTQHVDEQSKEYMTTNQHIRCQCRRSRYRFRTLLLHISFLAIHLSLAALTLARLTPGQLPISLGQLPRKWLPQLIQSPASAILQHHVHSYHSERDSEYVQDPSPEMDQRWKDLLLGNFFKLSPADLAAIGRLDDNPVLLEDGSGIGLLNMHHEVHCVMGLWQASHPEYYWPNATAAQVKNNRHHVDHCLDYLMQAAMCHGDVGFMTYHWDMDRPNPYWQAAEHTCVDFESVRSWLLDRKVPIHDPGFLVHPDPKFGAPYPDGVESIPTIMDLKQ